MQVESFIDNSLPFVLGSILAFVNPTYRIKQLRQTLEVTRRRDDIGFFQALEVHNVVGRPPTFDSLISRAGDLLAISLPKLFEGLSNNLDQNYIHNLDLIVLGYLATSAIIEFAEFRKKRNRYK